MIGPAGFGGFVPPAPSLPVPGFLQVPYIPTAPEIPAPFQLPQVRTFTLVYPTPPAPPMPPQIAPNPMRNPTPLPMPVAAPPFASKEAANRMKHRQVKQLMKLFYFCCKNGLYEEAEDVAAKAHQIDPKDVAAEAAVHIAHRLAAKAGSVKKAKAEDCTEQSQTSGCGLGYWPPIDGKDEKVHNLMQQFSSLYKQGKYHEARMCAQKVLELDPCNVVAGAALKLPECVDDPCPAAKHHTMTGGGCSMPDTVGDCGGVVKADYCPRGQLESRIYPIGDILTHYGPYGDGHYLREFVSVDAFVKMICDSIAPETWSQMGGPGTITPCFFGQVLVIRQTLDVQEQVAEKLAALRASAK
jgi:hypothetical protein